jgi:AAA+ ATPase superfamily predicted ATPase
MLIGRKAEIEEFKDAYDSGRAEFIALYGRRRVGKTYLVKSLFESEFAFYHTGIADSTSREQLAEFHEALREYGNERDVPDTAPANWSHAFRELRKLLETSKRKRKIVFLDELPWMDTPRSDFVRALEYFWNSWASTRNEIMLIVCGSAASWVINKLIRNRGGLHNRVTRRILLQPFSLEDCEEYYNTNNFVVSKSQILENYMIFGGIPFYLNLLRKKDSFPSNIDRLCFAETGVLREEFGLLYSSLFKHSERHMAIVRTLAKKAKGLTREDICRLTGVSSGGTLTKELGELELSGFIRSYKPFSRKIRGALYQLIDPYTLFYLKFIENGPADDEAHWAKFRESQAFKSWSGYAFEQVCLAHVKQIKRALGISGIITNTSSWNSETSDPGAQIDLVIDRNDGTISLCEMKYSETEYTINKQTDANLRHKRQAFIAETKTSKAVHLVLVTSVGLKKNLYSDTVQFVVAAEDLFSR